MMDHDYQNIPLQRLVNLESTIQSERIVQESIITLHSIGEDGDFEAHTSLLGTPSKIKELHIGHLVCEGLTIEFPSLLDFELRLCSPENFGADINIIKKAKDEGANIVDNILPKDAAKDSNCIVTDTWFSMGDKEDNVKRKILENYQVTNELINLAKDESIFLHCLPAHRGEEVTEEVIDGDKSFVWDEAENRVHAQKGIIDWCFS